MREIKFRVFFYDGEVWIEVIGNIHENPELIE